MRISNTAEGEVNMRIIFKANPKFHYGDNATIMCCMGQILSGSPVEIISSSRTPEGWSYKVQPTEYIASPVWVDEADLSAEYNDE